MFISEPGNVTVEEGETATFECRYNGSILAPYWRINNVIYRLTAVQKLYIFNDDFSVTVDNVSVSENGYHFQCFVGIVASAKGYLTVLDRRTQAP